VVKNVISVSFKKRVYGRDSFATANRGRTVDVTHYGVTSKIYEQKIIVSRGLAFFYFHPVRCCITMSL
jgi:hypothetical protein